MMLNNLVDFYNTERIPGGINNIRKEDNLYIYGASDLTVEIISELKKYNICIKGIIVSDKFYHETHKIEKYKIDKFSDVLCKQNEISIIAGFDIIKHEGLLDQLMDNVKIKKIYVFDGCTILFRNGFNFLNKSKIYFIDSYYNSVFKRKLNYDYYKKIKIYLYKHIICYLMKNQNKRWFAI